MTADGRPIIWSPQPGPQTHLLTCPVADVFWGGGRGAGKSDALIGDWLSHMTRYGQHTRGLFFRKSFPELQDVWARMTELYPATGAESNKSEWTWTWPNGAQLQLRYLENDDDAARYMGRNATFQAYDEAGNWPTPSPIDKLYATLRSAHGIKCVRRLTGNPGGPGTCVPFGDVLTPGGWVPIRDMKVGDPVYTVSGNGTMHESVVGQVHAEWFDGEVYSVSARGLRMVCTPNHRVAKAGGTKKNTGAAFSLVPISKLPGQATIVRSVEWSGSQPDMFSPPNVRKYNVSGGQPQALASTLFFELLGWWLSEGSATPSRSTFAIHQKKPQHVKTICNLLTACGFKYRTGPNSYMVDDMNWSTYFASLGKQPVRRMPQWVKQADREHLQLLFDAMVDGDGHRESKNGGTYYSASPGLADDFAEIALKLGYVVYQNSRARGEYWHNENSVSFKKVKSGGTELLTGNHVYNVATETKRRSDVSRVPFSGWVYCIGVEGTETFLIRQCGSVWVSGNSWLKERYVDPSPPYVPFWWAPNPNFPDLKIESVYIPARLEHNKLLLENDPGYEARLAAIGDPELYKAWRYGDWNVLSGRYFSTFKPEAPAVIPQVTLSPWFIRWIGVDWGFSHNSSVHWGCYDGTNLFVYREFVANELTPVELAQKIVELTGKHERIERVFLSPDAFARKSSVRTIADEIRQELPWPVVPADNDRIGGWSLIQQMFKFGTLRIFDSCGRLTKWLGLAQRDPKRPEDVLKTEGDDVGDSLRYLVKSTQIEPVIPPDIVMEQKLKPYLEREDYMGAFIQRMRMKEEQNKNSKPLKLKGRRR